MFGKSDTTLIYQETVACDKLCPFSNTQTQALLTSLIPASIFNLFCTQTKRRPLPVSQHNTHLHNTDQIKHNHFTWGMCVHQSHATQNIIHHSTSESKNKYTTFHLMCLTKEGKSVWWSVHDNRCFIFSSPHHNLISYTVWLLGYSEGLLGNCIFNRKCEW